ncbi:CBS domain-containing protein [Microseira sp. BLCC-F43]|uniref:CBS domain-containing protein n=1 Tax=Microseira sp. BLCC-F43 TaxID=3153602 RepID=UPI0035B96E8F
MIVKAKDIMTQDVALIRGSATVEDAVKLMRLKGVRSLVVETRSDEDAYGIVTEADIAFKVVAYGKDTKQVRVYEIMTKPCIVVNPDLGIEYVARLFGQTGILQAPVIAGELLGIISVGDIVHKSDFLENPKISFLEQKLKQAVSDARSASATYGTHTKEANDAWDLVDELEAELAFQSGKVPQKTAKELFVEALLTPPADLRVKA